MAQELAALADPAHTALVTQECQGSVIGSRSVVPELAAAAATTVIPNVARLVRAARPAGVPVVHCVAARRADEAGSNHNARLFGAVRKSPVAMLPGTEATDVVPEIGREEGDLLLTRLHGLGPMGGTDLDPVLRNLGVTTIVGVGVSLNLGMCSFAMDAVNNGYQFVLPADATAGVPADYAEAVVEHTLSLIATVVSTDELVEVWG